MPCSQEIFSCRPVEDQEGNLSIQLKFGDTAFNVNTGLSVMIALITLQVSYEAETKSGFNHWLRGWVLLFLIRLYRMASSEEKS